MPRFSKGWVKMDRSISLDPKFENNVWLFALWHWLLASATYLPTQMMIEGKLEELPPGTVVFSSREISDRWGCSRSVIQKWIRFLTDNNYCIAYKKSNDGVILTIKNWDQFQESQHSNAEHISERKQARIIENDAPSSVCTCVGTCVCTSYAPSKIVNDLQVFSNNSEISNINYTNEIERTHNVDTSVCTSVALNKEIRKNKKKSIVLSEQHQREFDLIYQEYPKRQGSHNLAGARKSFSKNFASAEKQSRLLDAIKNYADYCKREKKVGTSFVLMFATFINSRWEEWENIQPIKKPTYLRVCTSADEI